MIKNIPYCFTKEEIMVNFSNKFQFDNWIKTKIKNNQIKRVRNSLYVSLDQAGVISSNKFQIACKVSKDAFISHHSAFEFYGYANQVFNDVIISSKFRFNNFEFEGIEYINNINKEEIEIEQIDFAGVRITSLERTVIDCIDNIELAGGVDELLNALEEIPQLDEEKLLKILSSYNKVLLYQKVGYLLENFNEKLKLSKDFFDICKSKLTNQIKYFLEEYYEDIKYHSSWKLMAPKDLTSRKEGGF